jgi:hypothetical protein
MYSTAEAYIKPNQGFYRKVDPAPESQVKGDHLDPDQA